jgi:uncharacterized protein YqfB (UPF0267 family)
MKTLALILGLLCIASQSRAEALATCPGPTAEPLQLHYPSDIVGSVLAGKITTTVRKGTRCFKAGDVLKLVDPKDATKVFGSVKVSAVEFIYFNQISQKLAAGQGLTVPEQQAQLVKIYGEEIKNSDLTGIYYQVIK